MINYSTCSNDSIGANCAEGCDFGVTGVTVGGSGGLTVLLAFGITGGGIIGGRDCSAEVDGSVADCVKRCSKRLEHNCRRDFFDSLESS